MREYDRLRLKRKIQIEALTPAKRINKDGNNNEKGETGNPRLFLGGLMG